MNGYTADGEQVSDDPYRTPVSIDPIPELHCGPREYCPACGSTPHFDSENVLHPRLGINKGKVCKAFLSDDETCEEKRDHLHQSCFVCEHTWIVGFLEPGE